MMTALSGALAALLLAGVALSILARMSRRMMRLLHSGVLPFTVIHRDHPDYPADADGEWAEPDEEAALYQDQDYGARHPEPVWDWFRGFDAGYREGQLEGGRAMAALARHAAARDDAYQQGYDDGTHDAWSKGA